VLKVGRVVLHARSQAVTEVLDVVHPARQMPIAVPAKVHAHVTERRVRLRVIIVQGGSASMDGPGVRPAHSLAVTEVKAV
jgi:hypothetical protein